MPPQRRRRRLEIGFNNKYLMDALKAAPADKVRLELTTGVSPVRHPAHRGGGELPLHGAARAAEGGRVSMEIKPYLRRPQFYETDGMSIIWHGNYVRWMEEARTDFMDQLGFPYSRAVEAGIDFALTDISCKYRAMTRFGEELAITVFIRRLSPAKLELGYEMREASTGGS